MPERRTRQEYSRYTNYSDAELLNLLSDGEGSFIPSAWQDLNREIASRHLAIGADAQKVVEEIAHAADVNLTEDTPLPPPPTGLGGWLIVFQVFVVTQLLVTITASVMLLRYDHPWLPVAGGAAVLATFIVGLLLMYAREPSTRSFWIGTMGTTAAICAAAGISGRIRLLGAVLGTVWTGGWAVYWSQSERVRATFGTPPVGSGSSPD